MGKGFPRKVLVSTGFGAGWATWNSEAGQFVAEHPLLIALREDGVEWGKGKWQSEIDENVWEQVQKQKDPRFKEFYLELAEHLEQDPADIYLYWGGFNSTQVVTVESPYRIEEYDGAESITESADADLWWY